MVAIAVDCASAVGPIILAREAVLLGFLLSAILFTVTIRKLVDKQPSIILQARLLFLHINYNGIANREPFRNVMGPPNGGSPKQPDTWAGEIPDRQDTDPFEKSLPDDVNGAF